jgi:hypothetical protein
MLRSCLYLFLTVAFASAVFAAPQQDVQSLEYEFGGKALHTNTTSANTAGVNTPAAEGRIPSVSAAPVLGKQPVIYAPVERQYCSPAHATCGCPYCSPCCTPYYTSCCRPAPKIYRRVFVRPVYCSPCCRW